MDPYRLPRHIVPTRYDIRLEPDLRAKTFEGDETISLTVRHPASELVLNAAADLEMLEDAEIKSDMGFAQRATLAQEQEEERWRLKFRDPIPPGHVATAASLQGIADGERREPKARGLLPQHVQGCVGY